MDQDVTHELHLPLLETLETITVLKRVSAPRGCRVHDKQHPDNISVHKASLYFCVALILYVGRNHVPYAVA